MDNRTMCQKTVQKFKKYLISEEKSANNIAKYMHDIQCFQIFIGDQLVRKNDVITYKKQLEQTYKPTSVNSMLAALNSLFTFLGWHDCRVKQLCESAGVSPGKVFPHNLRHFFARSFNDRDDNIVKLANILRNTSI